MRYYLYPLSRPYISTLKIHLFFVYHHFNNNYCILSEVHFNSWTNSNTYFAILNVNNLYSQKSMKACFHTLNMNNPRDIMINETSQYQKDNTMPCSNLYVFINNLFIIYSIMLFIALKLYNVISQKHSWDYINIQLKMTELFMGDIHILLWVF